MSTILLVDDDPDFRKLLGTLLATCGHTVIEAPGGKQAVALIDEQRPDLAVFDGLLPDGDGLKWIRTLRASGVTLPVLFVSSFWRDTTAHQELHELGVLEVIHKPISPVSVVNAIERHLAATGNQ